MYILQKYFKKILYASTAVLAGILLFVVLAGFTLLQNSLNPDFHADLFKKHDIYSGTQYVIESSMTGFINNLKQNSSDVYEQQKEIFSLIEKNLTPKLIAKNLDSLREGIFEYFKNERKFLPDIYLSANPDSEPQNDSVGIKAFNTPTQALAQINKVNLGAILLYMDRNDIVDYLSILKLSYYTIQTVPGLLLPGFLMFFLIGLGLFRKFVDVIKWIAIALISCSALELVTGSLLLIYAYFILPNNIYPVTMTLALGNEPVLAYLRDCINPLAFFLLLSGAAFLLIAFAAMASPKLFPNIFVRESVYPTEKSQKTYTIIRNSLYVFCLMILLTATGYRISDIRKDFVANDFAAVISKMKGVATVTQVIAAKEDAIYDVQLEVVDEKNNKPVPNVSISIVGRSSDLKKDFNETHTTNEEGEVKFSLDKGSFRLSFLPHSFPSQFEMPSPFFFDIKAAGTKVITLNLEPVPEIKPKWGYAEIEVLDPNNDPVQNLELAVLGIPFAPGYPDKVYSYSNAEGIAVFKLNEGSYQVNFTESKLPEKYQLPPNLDITVASNNLSRYTLRLVEKPNAKASPTPGSEATQKKVNN